MYLLPRYYICVPAQWMITYIHGSTPGVLDPKWVHGLPARFKSMLIHLQQSGI